MYRQYSSLQVSEGAENPKYGVSQRQKLSVLLKSRILCLRAFVHASPSTWNPLCATSLCCLTWTYASGLSSDITSPWKPSLTPWAELISFLHSPLPYVIIVSLCLSPHRVCNSPHCYTLAPRVARAKKLHEWLNEFFLIGLSLEIVDDFSSR